MPESSEQLDRTSRYHRAPNSGGVRNWRTGQGIYGKDPSTESYFRRNTSLGKLVLEAAYAESDLAAKMCDILPDDALCRGVRLANLDPEPETMVRDRMDELAVLETLFDAGALARAYGDSYIYLDDGAAPEMPFVEDDYVPGSLANLALFTSYEVMPDNRMVSKDFGTMGFDKPTVYLLRNGKRYTPIHPSRLIRTTYRKPPPGGWTEAEYDWGTATAAAGLNRTYCGIGILQSALRLCVGEDEGCAAVRRLMHQASVLDLQVDDLERLIDDPNQMDRTALNVASMASVYNMYVHGKGSTLSRLAVMWQGLDAILEKNLERIAIAADIPYSRFLGMEPSGLNASGEASTRRYGSKVGAYQRRYIDPMLKRIMPLIARDTMIADGIRWKWPAYVVRSSKELLEETGVRLTHIGTVLDMLEGKKPMPPALREAMGEDPAMPQQDDMMPEDPLTPENRESLRAVLDSMIADLASQDD